MRLLVSEIFPPRVGGSGRWLYEVYRRLPAGSVVVAAGEHPEAKTFDAGSGIRTERTPLHLEWWGIAGWSNVREYWALVTRLRGLLRKHGARELHVARCLPEGFAAWLMRTVFGVPYVVYVHGEETRTSATSRELTWMTHRVFRNAKYLVVNSRNTAKVLQDEWRLPANRIRIMHPGVDTTYFVPAPPCEQTKSTLGWRDRSVILTAGRLQVRKGHDMLIRALPAIRRRIPNVLYAIVGEGEERSRLETLARDLLVADLVKFHGEIDHADLLACYQQCDLFVLPNREVDGDFEGFGMVLVEAQSCGKPVIAGASGGTRETMDEGRTGCVIPCETPDNLAERITDLLSDAARREEMGGAARIWVEQNFDWASLAKKAEAILGD